MWLISSKLFVTSCKASKYIINILIRINKFLGYVFKYSTHCGTIDAWQKKYFKFSYFSIKTVCSQNQFISTNILKGLTGGFYVSILENCVCESCIWIRGSRSIAESCRSMNQFFDSWFDVIGFVVCGIVKIKQIASNYVT